MVRYPKPRFLSDLQLIINKMSDCLVEICVTFFALMIEEAIRAMFKRSFFEVIDDTNVVASSRITRPGNFDEYYYSRYLAHSFFWF